MISKIDKMIWEYQSKWGFKPKAILVTLEQMLEMQMELSESFGFGLLKTTNIFPNNRIIKYKGIDIILKEEVVEP